jgi:uncharacterized glyoxalase superfamily protein PhnB
VARLLQLRTLLQATDLDETIAFYEKLGFTCIGTWTPPAHDDGKPVWCQVERDGYRLMFNYVNPELHDDGDGQLHAHVPEMSGSIYLDVDDIDALFAELKPVVETFEFEIDNFPHGMREFAFRDPNGYLLMFGAPIAAD